MTHFQTYWACANEANGQVCGLTSKGHSLVTAVFILLCAIALLVWLNFLLNLMKMIRHS